MRPVVLLSDFGLEDHYVGVLHAVLVREAPGVDRIDLGHRVPSGDLFAGCFLLRCAWPHLPDDAVALAVVDPGVGGDRRAVAVRVGERWLVAPDNGLAAAVGPAVEVLDLDRHLMGLPAPSATFHGRDLFAPAAARLARGDDPPSLGVPALATDLQPCPLPDPEPIADGWRATILHVDRFGNLVTNLPAAEAGADAVAWYGAPRAARRAGTYQEAVVGEVVLLAGSSGLLELAVNGASAAETTGLERGDTVEVTDSPSRQRRV